MNTEKERRERRREGGQRRREVEKERRMEREWWTERRELDGEDVDGEKVRDGWREEEREWRGKE